MSDEIASGTPVPPATPATGGAFDWLRESHQASAPMAPLTDDIPAPALPPAAPPAQFAPAGPPVEVAFAPPPMAAPIASPPPPVSAWPLEPAAGEPIPAPVAAFPAFHSDPTTGAVPATPEVLSTSVRLADPQLPPVRVQPTDPQLPPVPSQAVQPLPVQNTAAQSPVDQFPPSHEADSPFFFGAQPAAPSTFGAGPGPSNLGLERHETRVRSGNTPLDWAAFVLAFLLPPIGLLLGIGAVASGSTRRGYVASVAKAAIGIGAVLTLVLGVAFAVVTKIDNDNAAHASVVASSVAWCTKLKSNPTALSSDTLGWPSAGDTIPTSLASIKAYESNWDSLAKIAPAGIRADSQKVADAAKSIESSVRSTQTLNDSGNVAEMQNVVATTSIKSWVSNYCN